MLNSDRDVFSLNDLADLYIEAAEADARIAGPSAQARDQRIPSVGELWIGTGAAGDLPTLVLVTWADATLVRGLVVFEEPELATADDLLVPAGDSPMDIPLVLCIWRDIPLVAASLTQYLGSMRDQIMEPLAMLLQHRLTGGFRRIPRARTQVAPAYPCVPWTVEPIDHPELRAEYVAGTQVIRSDDPRLRVQAHLWRNSEYLESLALSRLEQESGAEVEHDRRQRLVSWLKALPKRLQAPARGLALALPTGADFRAALSGAHFDTAQTFEGGTPDGQLRWGFVEDGEEIVVSFDTKLPELLMNEYVRLHWGNISKRVLFEKRAGQIVAEVVFSKRELAQPRRDEIPQLEIIGNDTVTERSIED